ncbi:MAG: SBBP repeat-containing protein, partial [Gammaproteobacteria bacterium]
MRFGIGDFDPNETLVIDPVLLSYGTYLGGNGWDQARGIAADSQGNAYIVGFTNSTNFPVSNPFQGRPAGLKEVFVTKLNPAGGLVYSTYLGGRANDEGYAIAVDSDGNAYITGFTCSDNFPIVRGFQHILGPASGADGISCDAFVAKLNASGTALIYSSYLGRSGVEHGSGIGVDTAGNFYVSGTTSSPDFFTTDNALRRELPRPNTSQAFITKFNSAGSALLYSSYFGVRYGDIPSSTRGKAMALDPAGNAYLAVEESFRGRVAKFDCTKSGAASLVYVRDTALDDIYGIAVDSGGNAYVVGETRGGLQTVNAFQPTRTRCGGSTY